MALFRACLLALAVASLLSVASAQQPTSQHEPALDVTSMDRTIDPAWIFFNTPAEVGSRIIQFLRISLHGIRTRRCRMRIATGCAEFWRPRAAPDPKRDAPHRRLGLLCLLHGRESHRCESAEPLTPQLDRIAQLASKAEFRCRCGHGR